MNDKLYQFESPIRGFWHVGNLGKKKIKATGYLVGKIGRGILRSHKTRCSV